MKTLLSGLFALGLVAGAASARTVFEDLRDTAPRSDIFADIQTSAPRSAFDGLQDAAPRAPFDQIRDGAPRSDGVFGGLENSAP